MKPKIIKTFSKIDSQLHNLIKEKFPLGFEKHLISFTEKEGKYCKALPFETEEYSYLIKINSMTEAAKGSNIKDAEEDLEIATRKISDLENGGLDLDFANTV